MRMRRRRMLRRSRLAVGQRGEEIINRAVNVLDFERLRNSEVGLLASIKCNGNGRHLLQGSRWSSRNGMCPVIRIRSSVQRLGAKCSVCQISPLTAASFAKSCLLISYIQFMYCRCGRVYVDSVHLSTGRRAVYNNSVSHPPPKRCAYVHSHHINFAHAHNERTASIRVCNKSAAYIHTHTHMHRHDATVAARGQIAHSSATSAALGFIASRVFTSSGCVSFSRVVVVVVGVVGTASFVCRRVDNSHLSGECREVCTKV